jgi:hypothetical protein
MTGPEEVDPSPSQTQNDAAQVRSSASGGCHVEIRIAGHLDGTWSEWLGVSQILTLEGGETVLRAQVQDQAALLGILMKLHRLNIRLIAFNPMTRCSLTGSCSQTEGGSGEKTEVPMELLEG